MAGGPRGGAEVAGARPRLAEQVAGHLVASPGRRAPPPPAANGRRGSGSGNRAPTNRRAARSQAHGSLAPVSRPSSASPVAAADPDLRPVAEVACPAPDSSRRRSRATRSPADAGSSERRASRRAPGARRAPGRRCGPDRRPRWRRRRRRGRARAPARRGRGRATRRFVRRGGRSSARAPPRGGRRPARDRRGRRRAAPPTTSCTTPGRPSTVGAASHASASSHRPSWWQYPAATPSSTPARTAGLLARASAAPPLARSTTSPARPSGANCRHRWRWIPTASATSPPPSAIVEGPVQLRRCRHRITQRGEGGAERVAGVPFVGRGSGRDRRGDRGVAPVPAPRRGRRRAPSRRPHAASTRARATDGGATGTSATAWSYAPRASVMWPACSRHHPRRSCSRAGPRRVDLRVDGGERPAHQLGGPFQVAGAAGDLGGPVEQLVVAERDVDRGVGPTELVPGRERPFEVALRFGKCEGGLGREPRRDRREQRGARPAGLGPVVHQRAAGPDPDELRRRARSRAAYAACRSRRSPGRRSASTASCSSAWRNA